MIRRDLEVLAIAFTLYYVSVLYSPDWNMRKFICTRQPYFWCWNPLTQVSHIYIKRDMLKPTIYQAWLANAWSVDLQAYRKKYGHAWHWMSFWDQLSLMSCICTIFNLPVTFSGIGHTPHEHSHLPGRLGTKHTRHARMQAAWATQPVLVHPRFTVFTMVCYCNHECKVSLIALFGNNPRCGNFIFC